MPFGATSSGLYMPTPGGRITPTRDNDKASGRFVRSAALDALVAPQFDAVRHEVRSSWRDGATRYGSETYTFRDGQLQPLTRETREYSAPGVYTLKRSRWADGAWQLVETVQSRGD